MRKSGVALAVLLIARAASAQLAETIEVRITNVDVVVTDRAGKPVPGLTKNDFELFEDGQPQTITNFYEIRQDRPAAPAATGAATSQTAASDETEPPVELRRRRIILFIDEYSIHPFRRNEIFKAVSQRFNDIIRNGDEAMIVTWNRGIHVEQPFTSDPVLLRNTFNAIEKRGAGALTFDAQRALAKQKVKTAIEAQRFKSSRSGRGEITDPGELVSILHAYSEEVQLSAKQLLAAMDAMLNTLAGVEGKKVMLYVGAHLPEQPGAELYSWLQQYLLGVSGPDPSQQASNVGPALSANALNAVAEASAYSIAVDIEKMARNANASGVTVYLIDASDPSRSVTDTEPEETSEAFTRYVNSARAFSAIAHTTGGIAVTGSRNFGLAVSTIANDLGSYYSLGYRSTGNGAHRLSVRTKSSAYRVRSRTSYMAKTAEQQIEDRVVSNVFREAPKSDFAIRIETAAPLASGTNFKIPLTVTIPPELTLLPDGNDLAGGFTVYIAVGDERGAMSAVSKRAQPVRVPASAKEQLKQPLVFTAEVLVRPGEHFMSVAVVDQLTNSAGFARTKVVAR